jgi:amide synthase
MTGAKDRRAMFDQGAYLRRIGYAGSLEPTVHTLRGIHRAHLESIPFDNGERLAAGDTSDASDAKDIDAVFDKLVTRRQGGVCGELNGLFFRLLGELGFAACQVFGGVAQQSGSYTPDFFHVLTLVAVGGKRWMADVGFAGPSFLDPLELVVDTVQEQDGCQYRITVQGYYFMLERRSRTRDWRSVYRFSTEGPRDLDTWRSSRQFRAEAVANSTILHGRVLSRAVPDGQLVMTGEYLLRTANGHEKVLQLQDETSRRKSIEEILQGRALDK